MNDRRVRPAANDINSRPNEPFPATRDNLSFASALGLLLGTQGVYNMGKTKEYYTHCTKESGSLVIIMPAQ